MSELHFDNEGEPAQQHPQCSEVRWRRFRNPGMRGAPEVVHEKGTGSPLYTTPDITYLEFRERVEQAPGRYRGDQVDATRRLIPGASPFYVTITEAPRNASSAGSVGEVGELIRELVRANIRQTEVIAERFGGMMESAAQMMRQASDILRAADGANLPRREPAPGEVDDDQEEEDGEWEGTTNAELIKSITDQAFPLIELWLMGRATKPATQESAVPPPSAAVAPATPEPTPARPETATPEPGSPGVGADGASSTEPAAPKADVRNQKAATPTPEQAKHLLAILNALQPNERKVARAVVQRMNDEQRAHWLAELSALSVEKSVELVRSMIPARAQKGEST